MLIGKLLRYLIDGIVPRVRGRVADDQQAVCLPALTGVSGLSATAAAVATIPTGGGTGMAAKAARHPLDPAVMHLRRSILDIDAVSRSTITGPAGIAAGPSIASVAAWTAAVGAAATGNGRDVENAVVIGDSGNVIKLSVQ